MQKYGCIPDLPDHRDFKFCATPDTIKKLPPLVDLRPKMPPVYNQLQLGSCTANAISAAVEYDHMAESKGEWMPSRLFLYYNERAIEGTIQSDAGAMIRDGIKSLNKQGICHESIWPYDINKFAVKPSNQAYLDAVKYQAVKYERVSQNLTSIKSSLALNIPVVIGISVYSSFESPEVAKTGIVTMPAADEQLLGGHAVLCVGYNDATQQWIIRNSWSQSWGLAGYFMLPYVYLLEADLSSDFWAINLVK